MPIVITSIQLFSIKQHSVYNHILQTVSLNGEGEMEDTGEADLATPAANKKDKLSEKDKWWVSIRIKSIHGLSDFG